MRIQIASVCISVALAGVVCESTYAQSPVSPRKQRYRWVIPSYPVNDTCGYGDSSMYGLAINDCGDVTGGTTGGSTCFSQPYVWCFCENAYQLPPQTSFNLVRLSGASPSVLGVGYDINNSGVVVGVSDSTMLIPFPDGPPWAWELLSYDPEEEKIPSDGSYALDAGKMGIATSVNDTEDPTVVGVVFNQFGAKSPFRSSLTSSGTVEILPLPQGENPADAEGFVYHVVTPLPSDEVFFVGGSIGGGSIPPCLQGDDATRWTATSPIVTVTQLQESDPPSNNFGLWGAVANTANPQGEAAGYRMAPMSGPCDFIAILWDKDGVPFELGMLPPLSASDQTEVLGMSPSDLNGGGTILVGRSITGGPFLWWRDPSTLDFDVIHVDELTLVPPIPSGSFWSWQEFQDVNVHGWILGNATSRVPAPGGVFHPVVLIPDPCPADFNLDGVIDGADLGILLAAWGPCSSEKEEELGYCAGDLNYDGIVNGADLGLLLAAWGTCTIDMACGTVICSSNSEMAVAAGESLSGSTDTLTTALGLCGFSSLEDFAAALSAMNDNDALAVAEALHVFLQYAGGEE